MDTERQMGYGMEKSGQSDLSSTLKTGLSLRNLKGNKAWITTRGQGKDETGSVIFHASL